MKGFLWFVGIGAAAGLGWWWYSKKSNLQAQSQFSIQSISFKPGIVNDDLVLHGMLINPSTGEQKFQSFTGDLLFNNIVLGKINYLDTIDIKPVSSKSLDMPLTLNNAKLLKVAPELLNSLSATKGIMLKVKGVGNTSFGAIAIDQDVPVI